MRRQRPAYGRWIGYIICLLGFGGNVVGQGSVSWDPVKTVCNILHPRGVIVENKMYVDGGEVIDRQNYYLGTDKPYYNTGMIRWQNEHLWELDLSSTFDVSTPPWVAHPKPPDWNQHYNGVSGTLWDIGDGKFYTLGGWMSLSSKGPPPGYPISEPYYTHNISGYYFQLPAPRVFAYDPKTGNWSSWLQKDIHRLSDTAFTQSSRNKVGYTFGGLQVNEKDSSPSEFTPQAVGLWISTMSKFDFRTKKFTITEMPDDVGTTSRVEMHCLDRVGKEGVLVAFAGKSKNNLIEEYRPMDEILVYDIDTSTWMTQKATGDIPPGRRNTCSVLVPAPDLSSYQIYVFSGTTTGEVNILDMYVLSIPMFSWTKVDLKSYPDQYGITEIACGLYEDRQLIIVPGDINVTVSNTTMIEAGTTDTHWFECNKGTKIRIFDTYDWDFKTEFDPDNKGSKVPPLIVDLVGGSDTGGATLTQPEAGWDTPALGPIFSTRNELPPPDLSSSPSAPNEPTDLPSSPPIETTNTAKSKTAKSNKGTIIGGVIGGCFCVLVVSVLILFWKRHRQAQPSAELYGADQRAELQMADPRAEMQVHYNHYPGSHELHAYVPQEISVAGDVPHFQVKPEEQILIVDPNTPLPH